MQSEASGPGDQVPLNLVCPPLLGGIPQPRESSPATPSDSARARAAAACLLLLDLVRRDFPFYEARDAAAWLAGVLSLANRQRIDGPVPLFVVDSARQGCGGAMLASIASLIVSGRWAHWLVQAGTEQRQWEQITEILRAAEPMAVIETVRPLSSAALEAFLTGREWSWKSAAAGVTVRLPIRAVMWAVGTQVQVDRALARRALVIRLWPGIQPISRVLHVPPLFEKVAARHKELLQEASQIVELYLQHKEPAPAALPPFGGFEAWSATVRAAMVWAGLPDPVAAAPVAHASRAEPEGRK